MNEPSDTAGSDTAERLFLAWVEEHGRAHGPSFDEFCARHEELRPRLLALGAVHESARVLLEETGSEAGPSQGPPEVALEGTRYESRGQIARGGMGAILAAFDPSLRRTIAVKVLRTRAGRQSSEESRARPQSRLHSEAQVLAQLDHPGIVPIYEVGQDARGEPYFTMKRVEGRDFLEVIGAHHAGAAEWSLPRAVEILRRVCEAVAYAHEKGVIHRDLKPANVMVGRFGEVFVMDWGLAKVRGEAEGVAPSAVSTRRAEARSSATDTGHGAVLGTPAYMAPEQARGQVEALDARTDVYAIGAMLYQLLSGRPPHELEPGEPVGVLRRPPVPLARAARGAPEELVAICEKAMAHRPAERYPGALELAAELEAWLEGRVVRAHRTGAWAELQKWIGRNRWAAAAVAMLVVGLGTTAVVQAVLRRQLTMQADALRREDAANHIALASAAYSNGVIAHMQALLAECPEDLRGWEWRYLAAAADTSARVFRLQELELSDAQLLCESGALLVAGSGSPSRLQLLAADTGALLREFGLPEGHVINNFSLSADGERLAVFAHLGFLHLWDAREWSALPALDVRLHGWHGCTFAPSGRRLAAFGTEGVQVWDVDARAHLATLSAGQRDIADVAWSPDGTRLAAASWDGSVSVWDVERARLEDLVRVTEARLQRIEWSPDGRWLAGGDWDSRVHFWDGATLEPLHRSDRLEGHVLALAWSPDSRFLAVGGHGVVIHLFEAGTWEPAGRLIGHGANVRSLRFADDGRTLVSTCALGTVRLWDVEDERWRTQSRQGKLQGPAGVAFAADGARAAVAWSDGSVEVWDPRTRRIEERFTCPTGVRHVDWSRGASRLAFASWEADVFVYDEDGLHAAGARSGPRRFSVTEPTEAHFDPSGALLAATAQDGNVRVWELASGNLLWREAVPFQGQAWPGVLFGAHWAPRQDELVVCGQGGRIQVRDGFTGRLLRETLRPGKLFAQFSPDGEKILAWAYAQNQGLELLDAATLALLWETGQTNHMWPMLAPDGARLFSANWQGLLGVWDAADGRLLTEIEALPPGNPRLAVSPDGECVILAVGGRVGFLDARHGR